MPHRPARSNPFNDVGPTPKGLSAKGAPPADAMLEPAFARRGPPGSVHVSPTASREDRGHLKTLHR
jgi:hypothetical protein